MGRYDKGARPLKPSGFGIVVDKSKATETIALRCKPIQQDKIEDIYEPPDNVSKMPILFAILVWIAVGLFMFYA